jgi:inorganic pyrophosphatase
MRMGLPRASVLAVFALTLSVSPVPADRPLHTVQPAGCPAAKPPAERLPDAAGDKLDEALDAARAHKRHLWRDTVAVNADGTVNVLVEIAAGSSEKREFDMKTNRLELDRTVPESLGGYPTGYGFIPQTIGVDGDPYDGLVLGDSPAGQLVRGRIVGIMHMTDEKGHDAKIVVVPESGSSARRLDAAERVRIAEFFNRYKAEDDDEESWACVSGWGDEEEARQYLEAARRLFARGR